MNMQPGVGATPHRGAVVLVLGILSLVVCALLGPVAWVMGKGDLDKMGMGTMDPTGRGLTQAGMICGIIGTVFLGIGVIFGFLWVVLVLLLGIGAAAAGA